jgi:hypothetical protein
MKSFLNTATVISMSFTFASAQSVPRTIGGVPVQMVLTAEPFHGSEVPPIKRGDVRVMQDKSNLPVTEWVSLQDDMAGLELYVLIDEKVDPSAAARFDEIRNFISSQAPTTAVGVAFMENGLANIVQAPTKDHALAAKVLRLPLGTMSASDNPFYSLSALINCWSAGSPRRDVLIVTDGVDRFEDVGGASMYLDLAIEDAQRAGVQVFCLYAPGHSSHSPALVHGGQAFLAQLAEESGGEAYFKEGGPSPSFDPYLAALAKQLAHQYLVTFRAAPVAGQAFQRVTFTTQLPNVELISAHGFYLNAEERER